MALISSWMAGKGSTSSSRKACKSKDAMRKTHIAKMYPWCINIIDDASERTCCHRHVMSSMVQSGNLRSGGFPREVKLAPAVLLDTWRVCEKGLRDLWTCSWLAISSKADVRKRSLGVDGAQSAVRSWFWHSWGLPTLAGSKPQASYGLQSCSLLFLLLSLSPTNRSPKWLWHHNLIWQFVPEMWPQKLLHSWIKYLM